MTYGQGSRRLAFGVAALLFAVSFVNFFHTETTAFESRNCPACQANQAGVGVLSSHPVIVFQGLLLEVMTSVDTPLLIAERVDGLGSRSPPLS